MYSHQPQPEHRK